MEIQKIGKIIIQLTDCVRLQEVILQKKEIQKLYDTQVKKCEEEQFGNFTSTYFSSSKLTHMELLEGLQKYYVGKKKDVEFTLSIYEFIEKFPQKTTIRDTNYKKQHVFEALCRLLLVMNYDGIYDKKYFYESLEKVINRNTKELTKEDILKMNINVGNEGGIVDIFFKSSNRVKEDIVWACDKKTETISVDPVEYVMIQNKYYSVEKSSIEHYDVNSIYTLSDLTNKHSDYFKDGQLSIVLMVNNEDALSKALQKAKRQYPNLLKHIYGVSSLNVWFQKLLFDMLHNTLEDIVQLKKHTNSLYLRFHQKFIVDCTKAYIHEGINKFIWGAVPRSGKSYMIGGLIDSRKELNNDIVIILGAKTETLSQFNDMFTYANFDSYDIVDSDNKKNKMTNKKIYLISQEWLKDKINYSDNPKEVNFKNTIRYKFERNIDLYFDEVHKGGSTDKSENIIHAFTNTLADTSNAIDIFVMVTATFAKPTLRYNHLHLGQDITKIIEWSYHDQQSMKELNETKKRMIIESRTDVQHRVLHDTFHHYEQYYGLDYLTELSQEYKIYPELVIISPETIPDFPPTPHLLETDDVRNVFIDNLKCDACIPGKDETFYSDPSTIFNKPGAVDDLLNYIAETRNPSSIYNYFQNNLHYSIDQPNTQLWFLPDKDLYSKHESCASICNYVKVEENMDEDAVGTSIPNIEPLTRGLAIKICQHHGFDRYNIFINHNTFAPHVGDVIKRIFHSHPRIRLFKKDKESLRDQIRTYEIDSYNEGKGLIILTGAKLRLGISLPCADIAFNFDTIKSIDSNYQTMFRVLTERHNKQYGYYVDFNSKRAIEFLYEYDKIYGNAKTLNVEDSVKSLQSLLFTFNYNGLNLNAYGKDDLQTHMGFYSSLIDKLQLDKTHYKAYYIQNNNMVQLIRKRLTFIDRDILQQFQSFATSKPKSNKKKQTLKKGDARESMSESIEEEKEKEKEKEKKDIQSIIEHLSTELPNLIILLAIFAKEQQCSNLKECLEMNIHDISLAKKCLCETIDETNIIHCAFQDYNRETLQQFLMYILELLERDELLYHTLVFIFDNSKDMNKDGIIITMSPEDVEHKIIEHLTIRPEEKDKYGEVFTPSFLINTLLDELPTEVWSNPELTWFDPANGIGNFPMIIYTRLMVSLTKWEPNETKRSNHILTKMLFMNELNPKNVKISRKLFGKSANITCSDFLTNDFPLFDIIVGNPPFQKEKEEKDKKQGGHGKTNLWEKFVFKSLKLLKPKGLLAFITPASWRAPPNKNDTIYDVLTNDHHLLFLKIYSKKEGEQFFHVSQRFDMYVIQKDTHGKTTIIDEQKNKHSIDVKLYPFIPNYEFDTIQHLLSDDGIDVIFDSFYQKSQNQTKGNASEEYSAKYKYPVVHGITKSGLVVWYCDIKHTKHIDVPKVILNFNEQQYTYPEQNDWDGKYGMSQLSFGIPISSKKEGDDILKAMNTEKFKEMIKATKWTTYNTDYKMFRFFKKDFYKYFLLHPVVKLQALTRGHLERKTRSKKRKGGTLKRK